VSVCVCECVFMSVCECVYVFMSVCECVYVCLCELRVYVCGCV